MIIETADAEDARALARTLLDAAVDPAQVRTVHRGARVAFDVPDELGRAVGREPDASEVPAAAPSPAATDHPADPKHPEPERAEPERAEHGRAGRGEKKQPRKGTSTEPPPSGAKPEDPAS